MKKENSGTKRKWDRNTRLIVFSVIVVVLVFSFVFYYASAPVIVDRTDWLQHGIEQLKHPDEFWMSEASWNPGIYSKESKTEEIPLDLPEHSALSVTANTANVIIKSGDTNRAVLHVYRVGARNVFPYQLQFKPDETQKNAFRLDVKEPKLAPSVAVLEIFVNNALSSLTLDITNANTKVIGLTLNDLCIRSGSEETSNSVYIADTALSRNPQLEVFGLLLMDRVRTDDILQVSLRDGNGNIEPLAYAGEFLSKGIYAYSCSASEIRLHTLSGGVTTNDVKADKVAIETAQGSVSVTQGVCPYEITTQSGEITLSMPRDSSFQLSLDIPEGHLLNAFTPDIREDVTYQDSTLTVGSGKINIRAKSDSGIVNLNVMRDSAANETKD